MPSFFIDRPIFAWVVALFICLVGAISIPLLAVAQYPIIAPPSISISTSYPGASPENLYNSVTRLIEEELVAAAKREDAKLRKAQEAAEKRERKEEEKKRKIIAALKREEETRKRAAAVLAEVQAEKERQLAEALKRKSSFSKRCGGGFVVNFKPPQVQNLVEETEEPSMVGGGLARGMAGGNAGGSRRLELTEAVEDL